MTPSSKASKYKLVCTLVVISSICLQGCAKPTKPQLLVAAATSLIKPLNEIVERFELETGNLVDLHYAATGKLAQQIEHGAPVDLFLSADTTHIDDLIMKGRLRKDSRRIYARGQLVLWQRKNSGIIIRNINDLKRPNVKRIGIANPAFAPYGIAAQEALTTLNLWGKGSPQIIWADDVRQALQFAETGNVDGALIARSLIMNQPGRTVIIPNSAYKPIDHSLAIVRTTRNPGNSLSLANYICGNYGRTVFLKYGFTLPPDIETK